MPSARRLQVRPLVAVAAALGVTLLTSACSPDQWGTAARVGDTRISVQDLQRQTDEVAAALAPQTSCQSGGPLQHDVLQQAIGLQLVHLAAQREQVSVSEAEIDKSLAGAPPQDQLAKQAASLCVAPSRLRELVRVIAESGKLQEKIAATNPDPSAIDNELTTVADAAGVEVNPRYGVFTSDAQGIGIKELYSGGLAGLSTPTPSASPSVNVGPQPAP